MTQLAEHSHPFYYKISFKGGEQSVMISYVRLYDAKRLEETLGKVSPGQFKKLKQALKDLLF